MKEIWKKFSRSLYYYYLTNAVWEEAKHYYEDIMDLEKTEYYLRYYKRLKKLIKK